MQAYALLKPGGYIAVSDFTVTPKHSLFTRLFWPAVLGLDGVRPSTEHIAYLDSKFRRVHCLVEKGGFPYIAELVTLGGAALGLAAALLGGVGAPAAWAPLAWALAAAAVVNSAAVAFFAFCVVSHLFLDGEELLVPAAASAAVVGAFNYAWRTAIPWGAAGGAVQGARWYHALTRGYAVPGVYAYAAGAADLGALSAFARGAVPQTVDVPAAVWLAGAGALAGFALSLFLKAPYYSYVAQKRF